MTQQDLKAHIVRKSNNKTATIEHVIHTLTRNNEYCLLNYIEIHNMCYEE